MQQSAFVYLPFARPPFSLLPVCAQLQELARCHNQDIAAAPLAPSLQVRSQAWRAITRRLNKLTLQRKLSPNEAHDEVARLLSWYTSKFTQQGRESARSRESTGVNFIGKESQPRLSLTSSNFSMKESRLSTTQHSTKRSMASQSQHQSFTVRAQSVQLSSHRFFDNFTRQWAVHKSRAESQISRRIESRFAAGTIPIPEAKPSSKLLIALKANQRKPALAHKPKNQLYAREKQQPQRVLQKRPVVASDFLEFQPPLSKPAQRLQIMGHAGGNSISKYQLLEESAKIATPPSLVCLSTVQKRKSQNETLVDASRRRKLEQLRSKNRELLGLLPSAVGIAFREESLSQFSSKAYRTGPLFYPHHPDPEQSLQDYNSQACFHAEELKHRLSSSGVKVTGESVYRALSLPKSGELRTKALHLGHEGLLSNPFAIFPKEQKRRRKGKSKKKKRS